MIRTIMFCENNPKTLMTKVNRFLSKMDSLDYEIDTPQFSTLMEFTPVYYVLLTINLTCYTMGDKTYVERLIDEYQEDS